MIVLESDQKRIILNHAEKDYVEKNILIIFKKLKQTQTFREYWQLFEDEELPNDLLLFSKSYFSQKILKKIFSEICHLSLQKNCLSSENKRMKSQNSNKELNDLFSEEYFQTQQFPKIFQNSTLEKNRLTSCRTQSVPKVFSDDQSNIWCKCILLAREVEAYKRIKEKRGNDKRKQEHKKIAKYHYSSYGELGLESSVQQR